MIIIFELFMILLFDRHFPMLKFADDHDCDKDPDYNPSDCNESSENDECNITYQGNVYNNQHYNS